MGDQADAPCILIIEDNPLNMKLATQLLTVNGFRVLQAFDGAAGLNLIKTQRPALVLLDIHLPDMDGYQVFQKIHEDPDMSGLKVVALTASAMREDEQAIRARGFTDYIAKPIDTRRFVQHVREILACDRA